MKKLTLLLLALLLSNYVYSQGYSVDMFTLGEGRGITLAAMMRYNRTQPDSYTYKITQGEMFKSEMIEYKRSDTYYKLYFKDNVLCKLSKGEDVFLPEAAQIIKGKLNKKISQVIFDFGEPISSGDGYLIWRNETVKILLEYSLGSFQREDGVSMPLLGVAPRITTFYTLSTELTYEPVM